MQHDPMASESPANSDAPAPEYRRDPVTGRWVIIAPERSRRPLGLASTKPHPRLDAERDTCPFCSGRESRSPPELFAIRKAGTQPDTPGWSLRVVPNKFPAVRDMTVNLSNGYGMQLESLPGFGLHEVVIECPRHISNPAHLTDAELGQVFVAYRERIAALTRDSRVKFVSVFKNVGAEAGASLAHSHSQVVAIPMVPEVVQTEITGAKESFAATGHCLFCEMIERECREKVRIVAETPRFVAFTPYASRFAYEIWVLPRTHASHYETLSDADANELASLLRSILGKLDAVLTYPAYNYFLHTGPAREVLMAEYHWHLELFPRTSRVAGFEWASGCFINAVPPEQAASELRDAEPPPVDDMFGA
jgi:UDPglucose--hexose-1-phosphate uridylyltransferase